MLPVISAVDSSKASPGSMVMMSSMAKPSTSVSAGVVGERRRGGRDHRRERGAREHQAEMSVKFAHYHRVGSHFFVD